MTSSETFNLKWNDFQENIRESFRELRGDQEFADITLVCEDSENIEAHKVIISASSPVFRNIIKINKHSHPLIYMRGVKAKNLSYIVNFMYYGEVNVYEDELEDFLTLAEELKLKGLTRTSLGEKDINYACTDDNYFIKHKYENIDTIDAVSNICESIYQAEDKVYMTTNDIVKDKDDNIPMVNIGLEILDEKIESMLEKQGNLWTCKVCGKSTEGKTDLKNHIEGIHITGMQHPCSTCGKTYRSRNSLKKHISLNHKTKTK